MSVSTDEHDNETRTEEDVSEDLLQRCVFILSKEQLVDEHLLKDYRIINFGGHPQMFCLLNTVKDEQNKDNNNQDEPELEQQQVQKVQEDQEEVDWNDAEWAHNQEQIQIINTQRLTSKVSFLRDESGSMIAKMSRFLSKKVNKIAKVVDRIAFENSKLLVKNANLADKIQDQHLKLLEVCRMSYDYDKDSLDSIEDLILKDRNDSRSVIVYTPKKLEKGNRKLDKEKIFFGFRGTKHGHDALTDFNILRNKLSSSERFQSDLSFVKYHLSARDPSKTDVVFTGHSLGGSIATQMVVHFNDDAAGFNSSAVIFNAGTSPLITRNSYQELEIHSYTMEGDVISRFCFIEEDGYFVGKYKQNTIIRKVFRDEKSDLDLATSAHKLSNFWIGGDSV